ncbi:hypothetical protein [Salinigranum halophilum]|uniref:hypothetical protein n=1 Tax=Salinigranum halophilum TaxID=2565931 RepID=UPI0010A816FD|nr:hypothetical protein [Salinigranum halophilum]
MERRAFIRLSLLGGSLGSLLPSGNSADYRTARSELKELAQTFATTAVDDPHTTPRLIDSTERVLTTTRKGLQSSATTRQRHIGRFEHQIATVLSGLPGFEDPPDQPPIESEIAAIETAQSYYETVLSSLQKNDAIRLGAVGTEEMLRLASVSHARPVNPEEATASLRDATDAVESVTENLPSTDHTRLFPLLPNTAQTLDDLHRLNKVLLTALRVHYGYVSAIELMNRATQHREGGLFQQSSQLYEQALTATHVDVPKRVRGYSIQPDGLRLSEYDRLLRTVRSGLEQMKQSCEGDASTGGSADQLFDEGLVQFFDAHETLELST